MTIEGYRQKMELYILRAGIEEEEDLTVARFLSGINYNIRCTTPRRLSLTVAMKSVYITPKDANNHHIYAEPIKVTGLSC